MMKFVLVVVVVAVLLWLMFGRNRRAAAVKRKEGAPQAPLAMLACSHCGVHLPQSDALFDSAGRAYCGEAHRLAGPR